MSRIYRCPGSDTRNLTAEIIVCSSCGEEIEFFSDERKRRCPSCRHMARRTGPVSCADWCSSARECQGEQWKRALEAGNNND